MLFAMPLRLRSLPAAIALALAGAPLPAHAGIDHWTPLGPDGGYSRRPGKVYAGTVSAGLLTYTAQ